MNLFLINQNDNLKNVILKDKRIVETYIASDIKGMFLRIFLFDPQNNIPFEILPELRKSNDISIVDCIWNSKDIYFATSSVLIGSLLKIDVHRFSINSKIDEIICSFQKDFDFGNKNKKMKVFILNETNVLVQTEEKTDIISETMMGGILFTQTLLNLETNKETQVIEANLINNGLNNIIPVSDSKIMVKTGYSYLEDNRLDMSSESEALIESVYITTIAKFIADITLMTESIDMELISSAYFEKHLSQPFVTGDYIHFSILDFVKKKSSCIFYNYNTGETISYDNHILDTEDTDITYVINNIPYVRINNENGVDFFNLKNAEIDVSFYNELFVSQFGRLFILSKKHQLHDSVRIYTYPKLKLIKDDRFIYLNSCYSDDNYYMYITKN